MPRVIRSLVLGLFVALSGLAGANSASAGVTRYVHFVNDTSTTLSVYVNFSQVGTVAPGRTLTYYVGDKPSDTTVLAATGQGFDSGPVRVTQPYSDFTLTLHE
jgi:hypothetical protein